MPIMREIAYVTPNRKGIRAPTNLRLPLVISEQDFADNYADHAKVASVSFNSDGVSNPRNVTVYRNQYIRIG